MNNIKHNKSCPKLIELYYESITTSKIYNLDIERYILNYSRSKVLVPNANQR